MDPWAQGWIIVHPLQTAYKNLSVSESHKICIPHRPESSVGGRAKGGCSREQFLDHGVTGVLFLDRGSELDLNMPLCPRMVQ